MKTAVPGLFLFPDFIDERTEQDLLDEIDSKVWMVDYARRLQYYGYRNELESPYDLVPFPVPLPDQIRQLSENITRQGILNHLSDQVIINEYMPGEGIRPHKDRNYYENQICGVNLGSGCVMRFIKGANLETIDVEISRRSIYVMQDDARKTWSHGIPSRKKDVINGVVHQRERRVSITYRKVKTSRVHPLNPDGKVAGMLQQLFGISS